MKIIFLLTGLIFFDHCFAQIKSIPNRITIKPSVGRYPTANFISDGQEWKNIKTNNFRLEGTYGFYKNFEGLVYFGGQNDDFFINSFTLNKLLVPYFGLGTNFHLLPIFQKTKNLPIDLYASLKFGGLYVKPNSNAIYSGLYPEYSMSAGTAFYVIKGFGIFTEFGIGKFYFRNQPPLYFFPEGKIPGRDWYKLRIGLVYKFSTKGNETKLPYEGKSIKTL